GRPTSASRWRRSRRWPAAASSSRPSAAASSAWRRATRATTAGPCGAATPATTAPRADPRRVRPERRTPFPLGKRGSVWGEGGPDEGPPAAPVGPDPGGGGRSAEGTGGPRGHAHAADALRAGRRRRRLVQPLLADLLRRGGRAADFRLDGR